MRVLSTSEERRLLLAATPRLRPLIRFALQTGLRRGELLNLTWDDIDWHEGKWSSRANGRRVEGAGPSRSTVPHSRCCESCRDSPCAMGDSSATSRCAVPCMPRPREGGLAGGELP